MRKKITKALVVALSLFMCLFFITGCSQPSRSFADLLREINSMEQYTSESQITVSIKNAELSEALIQDGLPGDLLEKIEIKYNLSADIAKMLYGIELEVSAGGYTVPLSMYIDNSHIYVKVEDCLQLIDKFGGDPELLTAFQSFFGDAEWVDLMSEDDIEAYSAMMNDKTVKEYLDEYDRFVAAFSKAYANFETKTFSATSNSYKITLDNASLGELIGDFFEYTVNNAEQIANAFIEYANASTLLNADEKADFVELMHEMVEAAAEVEKADIAYTTTYIEDALTNDECPFDFDLTYLLSKVSSAVYKQSLQFKLDINDDEPAKITWQSESTIRGNKSLDISLPEMKTARLDDLIEAAEQSDSYVPTSIRIRIYLDSSRLSYTKSYKLPFLEDYGFVDTSYKMIDGFTYLPLRQISEICGIEANWDPAKKQPYVILNEQPVYMSAFVDAAQGATYIKIRDFEKLGFMVDYKPADNMIVLVK